MKLQSRMRTPGDRDVLQRTGSEGPSEERHLQRLKQAEAASRVGAAAIPPAEEAAASGSSGGNALSERQVPAWGTSPCPAAWCSCPGLHL